MRAPKDYRRAALLLSVSALLHLTLFGLVSYTLWMPLAFVILFHVALAVGLAKGWRWVAYLSFVALLTGAVTAFSLAITAAGVAALVLWAIVVIDLLAVMLLFRRLWSTVERVRPGT